MNTRLGFQVRVHVDPPEVGAFLSAHDQGPQNANFMDVVNHDVVGRGWTDVTAGWLPGAIGDWNLDVHWSLKLGANGPSKEIAETSHEVFVAYAMPITAWSFGSERPSDPTVPDRPGNRGPNGVTDARLRLVTRKCQGLSDPFGAAKAIQDWLPTAGVHWARPNPNPEPGEERVLYPKTADEYWGLIGGESGDGFAGQCAELAMLHELALRQLGIGAVYEHILPTTEAVLRAQGRPQLWKPGDPAPGTPSYVGAKILSFNFQLRDRSRDAGEGGVRVETRDAGGNLTGARFYTEGSGEESAAKVVGVEQGNRSAEFDALWWIADKFPDREHFQQYVELVDPRKTQDATEKKLGYKWLNEYEKVPDYP
jgi:hypothetical protein